METFKTGLGRLSIEFIPPFTTDKRQRLYRWSCKVSSTRQKGSAAWCGCPDVCWRCPWRTSQTCRGVRLLEKRFNCFSWTRCITAMHVSWAPYRVYWITSRLVYCIAANFVQVPTSTKTTTSVMWFSLKVWQRKLLFYMMSVPQGPIYYSKNQKLKADGLRLFYC